MQWRRTFKQGHIFEFPDEFLAILSKVFLPDLSVQGDNNIYSQADEINILFSLSVEMHRYEKGNTMKPLFKSASLECTQVINGVQIKGWVVLCMLSQYSTQAALALLGATAICSARAVFFPPNSFISRPLCNVTDDSLK